MKIRWYWGHWIQADYGVTNLGKFMHWSEPLPIKEARSVADKPLPSFGLGMINWLLKNFFWRECAVLDPHAVVDAEFIVGFRSSEDGLCLVAPVSAARQVHDGPFAVRLGPKPAYYFTVGTAPIRLAEIGRIIRGTPEDRVAKNLVVY